MVEARLLLGAFVIAAAVWGFVALAGEVVEGDTTAFDDRILLALRTPGDLGDPLGPHWLEEAARDVTGLGGVWVLLGIVIAAVIYFLVAHRWRTALALALANAGGTALTFGLKHGFDRPRPELVPHQTEVYTTSFPSGHAMLSAVVYLTLGAMIARVQPTQALKVYVIAIACFLSLIIGSSRIYLGVHYPTDVLAGWMGGAAWALLCRIVLKHFEVETGQGLYDATPARGG